MSRLRKRNAALRQIVRTAQGYERLPVWPRGSRRDQSSYGQWRAAHCRPEVSRRRIVTLFPHGAFAQVG